MNTLASHHKSKVPKRWFPSLAISYASHTLQSPFQVTKTSLIIRTNNMEIIRDTTNPLETTHDWIQYLLENGETRHYAKGRRVYRNKPRCVLIVTYCLDSSSKSICWYAEDKSNLVTFSPLAGNWVMSVISCRHWVFRYFQERVYRNLVVITTDANTAISKGTMGRAQSENSTFYSTPIFSSR